MTPEQQKMVQALSMFWPRGIPVEDYAALTSSIELLLRLIRPADVTPFVVEAPIKPEARTKPSRGAIKVASRRSARTARAKHGEFISELRSEMEKNTPHTVPLLAETLQRGAPQIWHGLKSLGARKMKRKVNGAALWKL